MLLPHHFPYHWLTFDSAASPTTPRLQLQYRPTPQWPTSDPPPPLPIRYTTDPISTLLPTPLLCPPHPQPYIYIHIPIPHPYCSSFTAWAGDRDYSRRRYTITQTKRLRRRMQILRSRVVISKRGLSQVTRQLRQRHKGIAARRNVECRSDRIGVYYNMGIRHTMYGLHCMPYDIHHTMYVIRCTPYDVRHTMYAIH